MNSKLCFFTGIRHQAIAKAAIIACILMVFPWLNSCIKPGKGGKAILSVHVFKGECDGSNPVNPQAIVIPQATVYIKYGGTTVDTDVSDYDDSKITDFGGKIVFDNLKRGDYYLYAVKDSLRGGTHFEIQNRIGEREVVICIGKY